MQTEIAVEYKKIMVGIAKFAQEVMGEPPCGFSLVGMGSLARNEITPYSDFENMILIAPAIVENEHPTNYFRWFSVIFHIIVINLGETIIPSASISSLENDWLYDDITPRGISFDGMMPHACKFPLGRTQSTENKPWKTELIKTVNEMLKYLSTEESLKNGYHLSTILTKTCHIYGDNKLFEKFEEGVYDFLDHEDEAIQESVKKQMTEDLEKFATRKSLVGIKLTKHFNIKQVIYRSTTILISEMGRLHKISANSSFDILRYLADKNHISQNAKQKLMFAVALACQMRLKWYMHSKRQNDNIDDLETILRFIGKKATISYFRIAYSLQCDISKRLNLKKLHLYSNPKLLNLILKSCLNDCDGGYIRDYTQDLLQHDGRTAEKDHQRYYGFDECLALLEKEISLERNENQNPSLTDEQNAKNLQSLGSFFRKLNCFDDAIECYEISLTLVRHKISGLHQSSSTTKQLKSVQSDQFCIAKVQEDIGYCLLRLGKYEIAKAKFESSLQIRKSISSNVNTDKDVANSMHYIGCCFTFINLTDEALNYLKQSLQIRKSVSTDASYDISIAESSNEIGRCLVKHGKPLEALKFLLQALNIEEKLSQDVNSDCKLATTLDLIGCCLHEMGEFQRAKHYYEQALIIYGQRSREVKINKPFADKADWLEHCMDIGKSKESKSLFKKALLAYNKSTLDDAAKLDAAKTSYWYGQCLLDMGQPKKAKVLFEQAMLLEEASSLDVTTDRNVANTSVWIGRCLMDMKKPDEAKSLFKKALLIFEKSSQDVTVDRMLANASFWIGRCFMDMNEPLEAKQLFEMVLIIEKQTSFDLATDRDLAISYYWNGRCMMEMKKLNKAKALFEEALLIYKNPSLHSTTDREVADISYWISYCSVDDKPQQV